MNIAMISLYLPSGSKIGTGYQAHLLGNTLCELGHNVDMYSPCPMPQEACYALRRVDPGRRFRTFGFAYALRSIDFSGYDVIHAHGDDYLLIGRPRPLHVRTMHGSCLAEAIYIRGGKEKLRMAILGATELLSTTVAARTVAVSHATTRWYPWISTVIPNGVDVSRYRPGPAKSAYPTILFVGTLGRRKRGDLLLNVFLESVRPALPEARLWMVTGEVSDRPGVEFFGRLSESELIDLYQRAWVFCLPSSYEGFGVPYIEAMACGTPVVATPNAGAIEVLDNGKFGVLADPSVLGPSLLSLLRDQGRMDYLIAAGIDRSAAFDVQSVISRYLNVYSGRETGA